MVEIYALSVIFYAIGGKTWIYKADFLSNMSICDWNEHDDDDDDDYDYYSYLGTNCTDGNSEVNTLSLGKFLKNEEP